MIGWSTDKSQDGVIRWMLVCVSALALFVVLRVFVVQTFRIPSSSMVPTLLVGDHIIVNKIAYGLHLPLVEKWIWRRALPKKGDVIVFYRFSEFERLDVDKHYIKRVVAVPGDLVEVRRGTIFVNSEPLASLDGDAPQATGTDVYQYGPVKLKDDEFYVMGDNHLNSRDSRYFGPIRLADIQGKAVCIYWSADRDEQGFRIRWKRFGKSVS